MKSPREKQAHSTFLLSAEIYQASRRAGPRLNFRTSPAKPTGPTERDPPHSGRAPPSLSHPPLDCGHVGACADAQLRDPLVDSGIEVVFVGTQQHTGVLSQKVHPPFADLGQLRERDCLLLTSHRAATSMPPGDAGNPRQRQPVLLSSRHPSNIEHTFE
jgi:hypothetical protein